MNVTQIAQPALDSKLFASFHLGDLELALAVSDIQEVVNAPDRYVPFPLGPGSLKGLFQLRELLFPVIDLRTILKLAPVAPTEEQKVAIIEFGGVKIGLLIDRTGEVFKAQRDEIHEFDRTQDLVISGVFKKENGKRLIQALNIPALFRIGGVPFEQRGGIEAARALQRKRQQIRKQCISFQVGPARFALGIEAIQEIIKADQIQESALRVTSCLGSINLRGTTVPVVNFAALLGYHSPDGVPAVRTNEERIMILEINKTFIGFWVDSVDSLVSYDPNELIQFSVLSLEREKMFVGCIAHPGSAELILLERTWILASQELADITMGHNRLYAVSSEARQNAKRNRLRRRSYITFRIEVRFAVGIEEIQEIVDVPKTLLHPPGLPAPFEGVLNLRGELFPIVTGRVLYGMSGRSPQATAKVLIFKANNIRFGLLVDAVDAIVAFSDDEKLALPASLYRRENGYALEDVLESVEFETPEALRQAVMILNIAALASRVSRNLAA